MVGIRNPRGNDGSYIGIVRVKDKAVVSSGDYERFFEKDGVRYHHIWTPRPAILLIRDLLGPLLFRTFQLMPMLFRQRFLCWVLRRHETC